MSVFRVNLNNTQQGLLDLSPGTIGAAPGAQNATSLQRSVYIMGPHRINRKLRDGETFQDSNYYKRFCYPQCSLEDAILSVVTDDGSVWSDVESENTFPHTYSRLILKGTDYTAANNIFNILSDTGGYASFLQLTNASSSTDVQVRLNGLTTAVFTLEKASTQTFNAGDLQVSLIEISNAVSGADNALIEVMAGVKMASAS